MLVELTEAEMNAIITMADITVRQQGLASAEGCLLIAQKMTQAIADNKQNTEVTTPTP